MKQVNLYMILSWLLYQAGIIHRCIYGDAGNQAEHACYIRVMTHLISHVSYQCNLSLPPLYLRLTTLLHPNVRVRQSLRL